MKKITFQICKNGAPYPYNCWWKIIGANGRIFVSSEIMSPTNARRSIKKIIAAVKAGRFNLREVKAAR